MDNEFSLTHLFTETVICAGIHIAFGIFNVEPLLEGVAAGLKSAFTPA